MDNIRLNIDQIKLPSKKHLAKQIIINFQNLFYRLMLINYKFTSSDIQLLSKVNLLNQIILQNSYSDLGSLLNIIINLCEDDNNLNPLFKAHEEDIINIFRKVGDQYYGIAEQNSDDDEQFTL